MGPESRPIIRETNCHKVTKNAFLGMLGRGDLTPRLGGADTEEAVHISIGGAGVLS